MGIIRDASRTKEAILDAAECLIVEKGFQALTLDEVAIGASVSKGGLLHHFPSKQSLLLGLAEHMIFLFEQEVNAHRNEDPDGPGAFTRAYLRATLACADKCAQVCNILTVEARNYPPMLKLFQDYLDRCQQRLEDDGLKPVTASLVRYAADGLSAAARAGLPKPANYDQVFAHLMELAGTRRAKSSPRGKQEVLSV